MLEQIITKLAAAAIGAAVTPILQQFVYPWFIELFRESTKLRPTYIGNITWSDVGQHKISLI